MGPNYSRGLETEASFLLEVLYVGDPQPIVQHGGSAHRAERPHVALAALWLLDKGDICSTRTERPNVPTEAVIPPREQGTSFRSKPQVLNDGAESKSRLGEFRLVLARPNEFISTRPAVCYQQC